jgi:N-acetylglucosaminyl-diphospho-decaprenol L-rhamnosyltransferase
MSPSDAPIIPAESIHDSNLAVVVVNYRTPELTMRCLAALSKERQALPRLRVVVVDGGSGDGSADELSAALAHPNYSGWVELLPLRINGGFGWANNQGILSLASKKHPPEFIYLLNPDAEVSQGAVLALADFLRSHPRVAAVGSQLLNPDGSLAGSAFSFPSVRGELARGATTRLIERLLKVPPISSEVPEATEVDWVTGASVLLRVDALREVGLFDEGFFLYNDEVELMWRLRKAGWAIATEPRSRVRHVGGASTGVSDRRTEARVEPRMPAYVFRSRTRFFGLTRGPAAAAAAYVAWLAGHAVWRLRRLLGVPIGKPVDHLFRDHLRKGFPHRGDFTAAVATFESEPGRAPAWMERRWL